MTYVRPPFLRGFLAMSAAMALVGCAGPRSSQETPSYFLSVQDGRAGLADGKSVVRDAADTLAVVELAAGRLRVVQQVTMPTSLVGPPSSVAIAPDGGRLRPAAELSGGQWLQGHAFSSDGSAVLVQDAANRQIRLYRNLGSTLADTGERLQLDGAPAAVKFWH